MTQERRAQLIRLALLSFVIDVGLSLVEIPFFAALPFAMTIEELAEMLISTLIARHELRLDFWDRLIGLIPIPGITAVTVRVIREIAFNHQHS